MDRNEILRRLANKEITPAQAKYLFDNIKPSHLLQSMNLASTDDAIAVIGVAVRFPGANDIDKYWQNLLSGVCSVSKISKSRWDLGNCYVQDPLSALEPNICWAGLLDNITNFDADFFQIPAYDACFIDPQQRMFLEECYRALDGAGYSNERLNGLNCGIYAGINEGDYGELVKSKNLDKVASCALGVPANFTAARIAYFLNLKGPAITLDTACSSSLVAIHLACQGIRTQDCDIALAGGVFTMNTPDTFIKVANLGILSTDGKCRPFDINANGTVISEGVGVVVLKSLKQAIADHDHIYGLIKASAVNQDGKTNGIAAPNSGSQIELIRRLYNRHSITPSKLSYLEAHGTGTQLGDAIEFKALAECFGGPETIASQCALGSTKANIGHTSAAAGIAGFIKALMVVYYEQIPPQINYQQLNANLSFKDTPFYINNKLENLHHHSELPMAAVSSFSIVGTNAHVVLQQVPKYKNEAINSNSYHIIVLSAKNTAALNLKIKEMYAWLNNNTRYSLDDIAYSLNVCKTHFSERICVVVNSMAYFKNALKRILENDLMASKDIFSCSSEGMKDIVIPAEEPNKIIDKLQKEMHVMQAYPLLCKLAQLFVAGKEILWERIYPKQHHWLVPLPAYPFAGKKFWITDIASPGPTNISVEEIFATFLGVAKEMLDNNLEFERFGVDSVLLIQIINRIKEQLDVDIDMQDLLKIATISQLKQHIDQQKSPFEQQNKTTENNAMKNNTNVLQDESNISEFLNSIVSCQESDVKLIAIENNMQVEIIKLGKGRPLLFLPPVDCLFTAWFHQINYFAKKYQVIVVHYPGYGRSTFQKDDTSIDNIVCIIRHVLEKLDINEPLAIIGWSLGGLIAQQLVINCPELVNKLCLVNTTSRLEVDHSTEYIEKLIHLLKDDLARITANLKTTFPKLDVTKLIKATKSNVVFMHYAQEILNFDARRQIKDIRVPVLIISGKNDALTPAKYSEYLASQIKLSDYVMHPTAGHYVPLADAKFFNDHLERFLDE